MSSETFNYQTATEQQILRHEAQRQANAVAGRMERAAQEIRDNAARFNRDNISAATIVADIVQTYEGLGGNVAPILWGLVRELGRMSDAESKAATSS